MATGRTSTATTSPSGGAHRSAGVGLLLVGAALVLLGTWGLLVAILDVPAAVTEAVADVWTLLLVIGGVWAISQGRRTLGVGFVALGGVLAVTRHVPGDLVWPVLVIAAGIAVIAGATGRGRRFLHDGSGIAVFGDRHPRVGTEGAQALIAVFGDVDAQLEDEAPDGVLGCLAVFGTVELVVPHDAVVEMQQTSVFGDVRAPAPARGRVGVTVRVRATAVFGDVRVRRA